MAKKVPKKGSEKRPTTPPTGRKANGEVNPMMSCGIPPGGKGKKR